ncbi:L-aspartate oxidase [uncultured Roseburia sp.]|uniref:FAD-binding protein n=1 Tax=Brotonthovivens ammoniilytica TaxID=2981725 RepID=A0ABT2TG86_9FIRM|nr:FAD-binding protein [Brotonthovivens ammoniilytica]MCU6760901.1 FAD-binding protein [Brotonthovivens ammoniilytica]SCI12775.1 L-aspartate oxidase [uncultured Roseburia sp.]
MKQTKIVQKKIETDILIAGGGIGGLSAAVTIKENNPEAEVLIVEKQTAGYAGKANKGGGVLQYFDLEKTTPMDFVAYHANMVGCYLGNQNMMLKYVAMNNEMLDKLEEWGVKVPKNRIPTGPMTYMVGVDLDITLQVRKVAAKLGVKFMDKTTISDLLVTNGKIAGAAGYNILDGTFYEFNSKLVIMATGSQNYRVASMWSNGRGDGIAAAYRAGAQMRNPEFGNFSQLFRVNSNRECVFGENVMYDAYGENITKNFRRFPEADISSSAVAEWYNQVSAGRGPIYLHIDENPMTSNEEMMLHAWERPYGLRFWEIDFEKASTVDKDWEVVPGFVGEQSPVKVDEEMRTTIDGMYAIGDLSYGGSAAPGAVPAPPGRNRGSGILNAVFAAIIAGRNAALAVKQTSQQPVDTAQVKTLKENAFAPLFREKGITAKELISQVQDVICPVENSVYMSGHRLESALRKIEQLKPLVSELKAEDLHDMLSCHEAEAMVLCAEMQFRGALMRKESRGWFLREDYPQMDNDNWLKWIVCKNENGTMVFDTEEVPIDTYPIQPPRF